MNGSNERVFFVITKYRFRLQTAFSLIGQMSTMLKADDNITKDNIPLKIMKWLVLVLVTDWSAIRDQSMRHLYKIVIFVA